MGTPKVHKVSDAFPQSAIKEVICQNADDFFDLASV